MKKNDRQMLVAIQQMVERVLRSRRITRKEYLQLVTTILADPDLTDEERRQINRIFDYIHIGQMSIVDW